MLLNICSEMRNHLTESQMETAHDVVFGVTAKRSSISQEDKAFLGRQFKSVEKMAMQEMCQNKTCQVSVICSSLKISYFRIGYLDVNIHLWQAGRIL